METVTRIREGHDTRARISVLENQVVSIAHNIEKLESKVDAQYATIHSRISDLRDDIHHSIEVKHDKVIEKLDIQSAEATVAHKNLGERLNDIEKWRWMLIGAAVVIGYVLAHIKLERFF